MATKKEMKAEFGKHHDCHCHTWFAAVILVLGVLFLLKDLGVWNFWGINWWTALLLLFGIKKCAMCCMKR